MVIKKLTIGRLAKATSVGVETIRYYQRVGLLQEPEKPEDGYREYPQSDISRVKFIKRAQHVGFTLNEISELLRIGDGHCDHVETIAGQKLQAIETRLVDLQRMQGALQVLIQQSQSNDDHAQNAELIEALGS